MLSSLLTLLYRLAVLTLLVVSLGATLTLTSSWQRDNQQMAALRAANLALVAENRQMYEELAKLVEDKRALDEELYKERVKAKIDLRNKTL